MTMLASQITSLTVVYSIVYSGVNQRKHQSPASLAFVREIHRGPVNFPHKWPITRKMFPFDDVIMALPLPSVLPLHIDGRSSPTLRNAILTTYTNYCHKNHYWHSHWQHKHHDMSWKSYICKNIPITCVIVGSSWFWTKLNSWNYGNISPYKQFCRLVFIIYIHFPLITFYHKHLPFHRLNRI